MSFCRKLPRPLVWALITVSGFAVFLALLPSTPAAIQPSPLDAAFSSGDEKAVTDAITSSEQFKRAVSEAVKARDARKTAIQSGASAKGLTPEQAARVRFIEVLNSK